MAGPAAGVLLPDRWTAGNVDEFHEWLASWLTPAGDNTWLPSSVEAPTTTAIGSWRPRSAAGPTTTAVGSWRPRSAVGPMTVEVGPRECEDADEAAHLRQALGYLPGTEIVLAAAVSGPENHRFLAQLAIAVARRYDGLIDLDGLLPTGGPEWKNRSRAIIRTLPGRWHEIPYRTAGDEAAAYHVVDADLLTAWLQHSQFRMVK